MEEMMWWTVRISRFYKLIDVLKTDGMAETGVPKGKSLESK